MTVAVSVNGIWALRRRPWGAGGASLWRVAANAKMHSRGASACNTLARRHSACGPHSGCLRNPESGGVQKCNKVTLSHRSHVKCDACVRAGLPLASPRARARQPPRTPLQPWVAGNQGASTPSAPPLPRRAGPAPARGVRLGRQPRQKKKKDGGGERAPPGGAGRDAGGSTEPHGRWRPRRARRAAAPSAPAHTRLCTSSAAGTHHMARQRRPFARRAAQRAPPPPHPHPAPHTHPFRRIGHGSGGRGCVSDAMGVCHGAVAFCRSQLEKGCQRACAPCAPGDHAGAQCTRKGYKTQVWAHVADVCR